MLWGSAANDQDDTVSRSLQEGNFMFNCLNQHDKMLFKCLRGSDKARWHFQQAFICLLIQDLHYKDQISYKHHIKEHDEYLFEVLETTG